MFNTLLFSCRIIAHFLFGLEVSEGELPIVDQDSIGSCTYDRLKKENYRLLSKIPMKLVLPWFVNSEPVRCCSRHARW